MSDTTDHWQRREPIATRIDPSALETIERLAEQRRTTAAQVARVLLRGWCTADGRAAALLKNIGAKRCRT
jgi:hypothetical protein